MSVDHDARESPGGIAAADVGTAPRAGRHIGRARLGGAGHPLRISFLVEVVVAVAVGLVVASMQHGAQIAVVALAIWAVAVYQHGPTTLSPVRPQARPLVQGFAAALSAVAVGMAIGLLEPGAFDIALPPVTAAALAGFSVRLLERARRGPARTLVIGDSHGVTVQAAQWSGHRRVEVVATCVVGAGLDTPDYPAGAPGVPALRSLEDVAGAATRLRVEAVIVVPGTGFTAADLQRLSWSLERLGTPVGVVGILDRLAPHRVTPSSFADRLVVHVAPSRQSLPLRMCKFAADRVAGLALLVLVAPLVAVLCAAIRLDSPGRALFRQERVGRDGRPFTMYKLRTMAVHAPPPPIPLQRTAGNTMLFKMKEDPRVTRVGAFLRRSSLDELPQLINVVRGEMSLIGPRPALPEEARRYDEQAIRRTVVRPGMTGLWQVSGRSDLSWDESLALDLKYVDNWRMTDDAVILARTVNAVLRSRGAY